MGLVMRGDAVDGVDERGGEVRMIEAWMLINVVIAALAGVRGIQNHRRERKFWRAYAEGRIPRDAVVGGHGS